MQKLPQQRTSFCPIFPAATGRGAVRGAPCLAQNLLTAGPIPRECRARGASVPQWTAPPSPERRGEPGPWALFPLGLHIPWAQRTSPACLPLPSPRSHSFSTSSPAPQQPPCPPRPLPPTPSPPGPSLRMEISGTVLPILPYCPERLGWRHFPEQTLTGAAFGEWGTSFLGLSPCH